MLFAKILLLKQFISYSIRDYIKEVFLPLFFVTVLSIILPVIVFLCFPNGILRLLLVTGSSILSTCTCMFFIGLNKSEQKGMLHMISLFIQKIGNNKVNRK
jgi:hypothetical protein